MVGLRELRFGRKYKSDTSVLMGQTFIFFLFYLYGSDKERVMLGWQGKRKLWLEKLGRIILSVLTAACILSAHHVHNVS